MMGNLLLKNKTAILEVSRDTVSYGAHPRQKLDIYLPSPVSGENTLDSPYLVFLYGGGLVQGGKIIPVIPDDLGYHNLGTFFAKRGFTAILPDYRLVKSESGGHDAVFPSGAEDLSAVLKFVATLDPSRKRDVFILGNSAGGVHLATFLLEPRFLEQRKALISDNGPIILKGIVELGVPFDFKSSNASRSEILKNYYGDNEKVEANQPYGLLESLEKKGKSKQEAFVPKVLVIVCEWDPEEEIKQPSKKFVKLAQKVWDGGVEFWTLPPGHNHISPPLALMSEDKELEQWGEDVVKWMRESIN
jgi:acetyl esterase/lipase